MAPRGRYRPSCPQLVGRDGSWASDLLAADPGGFGAPIDQGPLVLGEGARCGRIVVPARYHVNMSSPAAVGSPALPPLPLPGAKPREIRAALHPEYREEFDRDYREALAEAGRALDLEGIYDTLEHWRMRSMDHAGQAGAPPGRAACR